MGNGHAHCLCNEPGSKEVDLMHFSRQQSVDGRMGRYLYLIYNDTLLAVLPEVRLKMIRTTTAGDGKELGIVVMARDARLRVLLLPNGDTHTCLQPASGYARGWYLDSKNNNNKTMKMQWWVHPKTLKKDSKKTSNTIQWRQTCISINSIELIDLNRFIFLQNWLYSFSSFSKRVNW